MRIMRHYLWSAVGCWLLCTGGAQAANHFKIIRQYVENNGSKTFQVTWELSQCDTLVLVYKTDLETHRTQTNGMLATISWSMMNASGQHDVKAVRDDNTIVIRGIYGGQRVDKTITIDDAPWFQATSLSLRALVQSPEKEIVYWSVRPETLKAYKLKAVEKGSEAIQVGGRNVQTVKIEARLTGWLAPFWKSTYWYDDRDGYLLKFESAADAQGIQRLNLTFTGQATSQKINCSAVGSPDVLLTK